MGNLRSLIVDDDMVSCSKLQRIMGSFGTCEIAATGQEALDMFLSSWENWCPYRLILLDISLGEDESGVDVLLEIRKMEAQKRVPEECRVRVVMVSSHADKENISNSIMAGCNDYIVKPFDKNVIQEKLIKLGLLQEV